MNRAGLEMIEADSFDQVKGQCVYPLVSEEYREAFKYLTQDVFNGKSGSLEFKMIGLKGRPLWLYTHAVPLRNEKGEVVLMLAVTIDITDRKLSEEVALAYRKRLEAIKELGVSATSTLDLNELLQRILKGTLETVGASVGMIFLKNKATGCLTWGASIGLSEAFISDFEKCAIKPGEGLTGHIAESGDTIYIPLDSSHDTRIARPVIREEGLNSFVGVPIYTDNEIIGVMNILTRPPDILNEQDVTTISAIGAYVGSAIRNARLYEQVKKAKQKIQRSEGLIRNIMDNVDEGFLIIDRNYTILAANRAYCSQVGKTFDDVIGDYCYLVSHNSPKPCFEIGETCAVHRVFETGEPQTVVHRHTDAEGVIMYVEIKAFPLKDSSGAVTSAIETITNITERHLLEEERLKTQKLEAIGTLAGGIAHDFNNLLLGVFGYISLSMAKLDKSEEAFKMLEQAENALRMSVNLTNQLLTFSKGGMPAKKIFLLPTTIENSIKFALSGSRCNYELEIDENLRYVEADEGQISQVIQNIVLNANQAMPNGGTIKITAKNIDIQHDRSMTTLGEGKYVEIAVQDTGIGIPKENLLRIFDPYFSTKQKGSGLGLATSYSIVKNHGGIITVKSKLGYGSTFYIYLPAIEAKTEEDIHPVVAHVLRKGKILLMDDEEIARMVTRKMIEDLGHEVEVAEDGKAAIEKYRKAKDSGRPFDIVILDLTVRGGMGGEEAIQKLLSLNPNIKTIVSSGYSEDTVLSDFKSYGFKAYLTKPYDLEALRDTLNALLNDM